MRTIKILAAALIAVMMLAACAPKIETQDPADAPGQTVDEGKTPAAAPQEVYLQEGELDADLFAESELTMVNIWATWCSPCVGELPHLGALAEKYSGQGVQIVGILLDGRDDGAIEAATGLIEETGAFYTHLLPSKLMEAKYLKNIQSIPSTLFFDAEGNQIGKMVVGAYDEAGWIEIIDAKLAEVRG